MNQNLIQNKSIKILFELTIFSIILLGLNQSANANEIIKLSGNIKLKKNGQTEFQEANFLDTINYQDKFQVGANSWIVIRCGNTDKPKIKRPGTYLVSKYCPEGKKTLVIDNNYTLDNYNTLFGQETLVINNNTFRPPTEDLTQIPYIISPRSSSIFPEQITIKWNPISEATSYQVKLGEWQTETTKIEVLYAGEPLKPGYYSVNVKANNGESSGDVGFVIIDEKQAQTIRKEAEKIKQEGLDEEAEAYILAQFYRSHKLNMLAIEILEDLVRSGSQTQNVYLLLADIYEEIGLKIEAYELYRKGLKLANK